MRVYFIFVVFLFVYQGLQAQHKPCFVPENLEISLHQRHTKLTNCDKIKRFFGKKVSKKIKIPIKLCANATLKLNKHNFELQLFDSSMKKVPGSTLLRCHGEIFYEEIKSKDSIINVKNNNTINLFFDIKKEWREGYDGAVYSYKLEKGCYFLKIYFYNEESHVYAQISEVVIKVK